MFSYRSNEKLYLRLQTPLLYYKNYENQSANLQNHIPAIARARGPKLLWTSFRLALAEL